MSFVAAAARVVVASLAAFSVFETLTAEDTSGWDLLNVQATGILAVAFLINAWALVAGRRRPAGWIEGGALVYAVVQGAALTLLAGDELAALANPLLFGFTNAELQTLVIPGAGLAVWLLFSVHRRIGWVWVILWPLYIVAYFAAFVARGATVDGARYPHAFLDLGEHGGRGVIENGLLIAGAVVVVGAIVIAIDRILPTRTFLSGP